LIIHSVEFVGSFEKLEQCPKTDLPEYAFIGRSNVGKSSLINMLLERKDIARISSTPGKTQTINYFLVNEKWYLVDLPGYGYARISKVKRKIWRKMIDHYIKNRRNLYCVFTLIDSRHKLQALDLEFINWLGEHGIPFSIAYTKIDKLKPHELEVNLEEIQAALLEEWDSLPAQFSTSANTSAGRDEILKFIGDVSNN